MRKFSALALVALLVFSLAGCKGDESVAVVNTGRLFEESESGKAGLAHLKKMEAEMQEQLLAAQAQLEKSPSDEALRAKFQKEFAGYQGIVQGEQQKVVEGINAQITSTIEKIRKKGKFAVILPSESVLAFDPKADVTDDVIKAMNAAPVTFEPASLKPEAPKADAPKEDAKAEAPKAEEAKAEAPKADAPKTEEPKAEAPKAEEAKAEAPKAN